MKPEEFKTQLNEARQLAKEGKLTDPQMMAMGAIEALSFCNAALHTVVCEMVPALQENNQDEFMASTASLMAQIASQAMRLSNNAVAMVEEDGMGNVGELLRVAIDKLDSHLNKLMDASEAENSVIAIQRGPAPSGRAVRVPTTSEVLN